MKVTLSNIIQIEEPTQEILDYCKNELTFNNPDYTKKQRMGFWVGRTPKTIKLYDYYNDNIYLPIGCFEDIWRLHPYKEDYKDYSITKKANIKSNIVLRNYQEPCADALRKYVNGIFVLPPGLGKTQIGLHCASILGQKTIWLTHTKELLQQAKERCENNLECTTSTITDGKCDTTGDIVFATVQTLVNIVDKQQIKQNEFGLLIMDEVHHLSTSAETVKMFEKCVNYFSARYKLGLTGTLHRGDGLENTTTKIIGNVIYELIKSNDKKKLIGYFEGKPIIELPIEQFQVPAQIYFVKTTYNVENKDVFDRNKQVLNIIKKLKGYSIVISERIDQLHYLSDNTPNSICIDGKTNKKLREKLIEEFRQGKYKVLFASYSLVAEGLDVPMLENLVMASPVKDQRLVVQAIGRVQRPYKDKKIANVYDLIDDVSLLDKFTRARKKVYKEEGWEIL